jgi:hypothetical protein
VISDLSRMLEGRILSPMRAHSPLTDQAVLATDDLMPGCDVVRNRAARWLLHRWAAVRLVPIAPMCPDQHRSHAPLPSASALAWLGTGPAAHPTFRFGQGVVPEEASDAQHVPDLRAGCIRLLVVDARFLSTPICSPTSFWSSLRPRRLFRMWSPIVFGSRGIRTTEPVLYDCGTGPTKEIKCRSACRR